MAIKKAYKKTPPPKHCPDCGAKPGELHAEGCDIERCPECGFQRISCECAEESHPRIPWTGEWYGVAECQELGFYCRYDDVTGCWIECAATDMHAAPDFTRLYAECYWNATQQKWVPSPKRPDWWEPMMIQTLYCMKLGIVNDVNAGIVPSTVASLSQLHDYTDVNEYGGFCIPEFSDALLVLCGESLDDGEWTDLYNEFISEAQRRCDTWLAGKGVGNVA